MSFQDLSFPIFHSFPIVFLCNLIILLLKILKWKKSAPLLSMEKQAVTGFFLFWQMVISGWRIPYPTLYAPSYIYTPNLTRPYSTLFYLTLSTHTLPYLDIPTSPLSTLLYTLYIPYFIHFLATLVIHQLLFLAITRCPLLFWYSMTELTGQHFIFH